jgi:hypothetical protein
MHYGVDGAPDIRCERVADLTCRDLRFRQPVDHIPFPQSAEVNIAQRSVGDSLDDEQS